MKTLIIINPKAGNGKVLKQWPEIKKRCDFLQPYEEKVTQRPGHITDLAREALKQSIGRIIIVGGDGSLMEAVNGFFENQAPINPNAVLGALPLGSGSDLLRAFGIMDIDIGLERLKKGQTTACDIGQITYDNRTQFFLNVSSFGCAGEIVNRANRSQKMLGPTLTYFWIMLSTFLMYKSPSVELEIDGEKRKIFKISNIFVCNGKYNGSGMMWAPNASINDGLFDVTVVKDVPKLKGMLNMRKIYQGKVLEVEGIEHFQCQKLYAFSNEKVFFEVDGDVIGTLPIVYQMFPHKIKIIG